MRILYLNQYFCTPKGNGGIRCYEFGRHWVQAGHEVHVITATSWYDPTLVPGLHEIDGMTVQVLDIPYSPTMGFFRRLVSFLRFLVMCSVIAVRNRDNDIVLATSTPLTIAVPGIVSKLANRQQRFVFEVRDVWPDAAVDIGKLRNPLLIQAAKLLERMAYRIADHVVPLSSGMQRRIVKKGVPVAKTTVIPNCSDLKLFSNISRAEVRRSEGVAGKFLVVYSGAINEANDIPCIMQVVQSLKDESSVQWWFIGEGNRYDWLKAELLLSGVTNVKLWGKQDKRKVSQLVSAADVGIVSFVGTPVYYENSPNKFFDYIASGVPVVFNRSTWLEESITEYGAGFVSKDGVAGVASSIRSLLGDDTLRYRMGLAARRMAEERFSRDSMADRYLSVFDRLIAESAV